MSKSLGPGVSLREQRGWWHIRFYDAERTPKRVQQALQTKSEDIAFERGRELYRKYDLGTFDPWDEKYRDFAVSKVLNRYESDRKGEIKDRTIQTNVSPARKFLREYLPKGATIRSVTPEDLKEFIFRESLSQGGQEALYRKLRTVFNWATREGYLHENPLDEIDKPDRPEPVPKYYDEEELQRLLRAVETRLERKSKWIGESYTHPLWPQDFYALAGYTGLRRSELERLNWGDVQPPSKDNLGRTVRPGTITVRDPEAIKTSVERVVTIIPPAEDRLRMIEEHWRRTDDPEEPVLKNHTGEKRVSGEQATRRFPDIAEEAGLENITLHGLRHTFAAICRLRGMPLHQLKDELGHQSIDQTQRYAMIGPEQRTQKTYDLFS